MLENKIQIIDETKNYLIINKPAGLIVHGGTVIKEKTLVDFLLDKYPDLAKIGEDPMRPAIVHRLDKEASGLMIIPKNNEAFEYYKNLFKKRKIDKGYIALVFGQVPRDEDVIDFSIVRSSQGHKMACLPKSMKEEALSNRDEGNLKAREKSRLALTKYSVLKRLINYTLLNIQITTGRTHQIRVHFSAYGHPLVGDNLYANKKTKIKNKKINLGRIFLMANHLGFIDQDGQKKEYSLEISSDLKEALKRLK
ncbi:MAG: RluA family pseudouridine synthase [Patescibacteria group bacterium]|jgi:23S rRNA pseudouridine1911/1915/1917 synthase